MTVQQMYDFLKTYIDKKISATNRILSDILSDNKVKEVGSNIVAVKTVGENIADINSLSDSIDVVKNVSDNLSDISKVSDNVDTINAVAKSVDDVNTVASIKDDVVKLNNNYSIYHADVRTVQAYLNVDLGSATIDTDGHLLVTQIDVSSTPSINDDGYLVINYN